ncbi:putative ATP-dependent RNA helicase TDRD12 isoform X2 [Belonocnema kinseyi]|nr:putative ATP-dependent RNA helicase TDRD12 isoform X2 [Belonocnema kinseyi]XP_033228767.1 putative ATP-dependent RNA helicase TDRD12 isoform X2 [Belonocnema kinseyi]
MRIYELENHALRVNVISKKLQIYAQKHIDFEKEPNELLNLGDTLIVFNINNDDLPAWWCRGILGRMDDTSTKYNVFLPDYGIALLLAKNDLRKIPKDVVSDEYLTSTIGLNEVVPATIAKGNKSKEKTIVTIVEEWTESAIQFTKELLSAADKIYFDPQACDQNGKKYGELYLIIEDELVFLSKALTLSLFAVHLNKAILARIYEPGVKESPAKKINDSLLITNEDLNDSLKSESRVDDSVNGVNGFNYPTTCTETETEEEKQNEHVTDPLSKRSHRNLYKKDDQQILIRSVQKCEFIESVTDARFSAHIHRALEAQDVRRPKKIQSYMWPAVKKGLDVIAVSPSDSGKTYGYLIPIVSSLVNQAKLPKGNKPTTLILCSSSSDVANVASLCDEFLIHYPHIKTVAALNGKPEKSLLAQIYNGCQILVATVPFLARFIKKFKNMNVIDLYHLRHIILDGADVILDKYIQPAMEIFFKHKIMRDKEERYDNDSFLQVIAVAQQWTIGLRQFMDKAIVYPYVCIGSYMEAAAFSQVQAKLSIVRSEQKNNKILEALNNNEEMITERIMIICTDAREAIELNSLIKSNKKKTLLAHSNMIFNEVHGVRADWAASVSGMYPILICTDDVLSDLNIQNVTWLIHHSVNLASKSRFYYRFSTLMDNWLADKNRCKVLIFVDNSNDMQFQGLVEIMKRLHATMPPKLINVANRIAATLDGKKKEYPICDNIKSLGFCPKRTNCSYRHCILKGVDDPITNVSIGDTVELMVTYVHDATHFSARLIKCLKKDQKDPIAYPYEHSVRLSMQMQKYYANVEHRRGIRRIKVGDICVMEDTIEHYKRVQILNIVMRNNFDEPSVVTVRCIDDGRVTAKVRANKLLQIPEHLANWQTNIIEVFLSSITPFDNEYIWDRCANEAVHSWFGENLDSRNSSVFGKVNLHLGNIIWTDTLEVRSKMIGFPEITVSSLRSTLIQENHGLISRSHLPMLYELCKSGNFTDLEINVAPPLEKNEEVE